MLFGICNNLVSAFVAVDAEVILAYADVKSVVGNLNIVASEGNNNKRSAKVESFFANGFGLVRNGDLNESVTFGKSICAELLEVGSGFNVSLADCAALKSSVFNFNKSSGEGYGNLMLGVGFNSESVFESFACNNGNVFAVNYGRDCVNVEGLSFAVKAVALVGNDFIVPSS